VLVLRLASRRSTSA